VSAPEKVIAKRGSTQPIDLAIQIKSGFHINSNAPADEYLIPLKLTFTADGPVEITDIVYPKPTMETLQFSPKPVSVFQGDIHTTARLKASPSAAQGPANVLGKLRYQACNDRMCLPPRTLEVRIPVEIRN